MASFFAQKIGQRLGSSPLKSSGRSLSTYRGHPGDVFTSVAWSPDGKRLASTGHSVQVWDAFSGRPILTCRDATQQAVSLSSNITWSPDGTYLAACMESHGPIIATAPLPPSLFTIQVWNASSGEQVFTYTSHSREIGSVTWSPDSKHIAFPDTSVQVWNVSTRGQVSTYPEVISSGVGAYVVWSPNGKRLAYVDADSSLVESWNALDGSDCLVYSPGRTADRHVIAWSPTSQYLACSQVGAVDIWNASTGHRLTSYAVHGGALMDMYSPISDLAWSPDGKHLASASSDATVEVCDATTGTHVFTYTGHADGVEAVAWSPDGTYLASASLDHTVQIWRPN